MRRTGQARTPTGSTPRASRRTSGPSFAAAAGATETVLFQHFPTKRALFLAVIGEFGPRVLFGDWAKAGRNLPAPEALRTIATRYLDTCWEHGQWLRVVQRAAAEDDDAAAAWRRQNQGMGEPLLALLQRWSARGEVPPELVEPLRNVIWLSARGFVDWVGRNEAYAYYNVFERGTGRHGLRRASTGIRVGVKGTEP